jgi:hypothetical protein
MLKITYVFEAVWWYVLGGHRAHLSEMANLRFDDTDYSVVVKKASSTEVVEVGDLPRR